MRRMRRRGVTVLTGVVLLVLLLVGAESVAVPYVALGPGPTYDTLGSAEGQPVIKVEGAPTTGSAGQLRLTTVSVQPDLTMAEAVRGWLDDERAVVPRELIYPPDKSQKQVDEDNARDFQASQSSAETAALRKLGYPVQVSVVEVMPGAAATGVLRPGDVVVSVDGTPVGSVPKLTELVRAKPAGTARTLVVSRDGGTQEVTVTPQKTPEDGNPRLGVRVEAKQPHPFQLGIQLDKVGGPSAGLMFALGIIDKLDPADLTGGIVVAGPGTIDDEGRVGPIGGVPQKLRGARAAKATVFLTPAANCAEAAANPVPGLKLVRVATLDEAMAALKTLREGGTPPLCAR
jgi:PDZ domain-containing protein